ncbi:DUF6209 family protein [Chondromyces apiculatus]|uniref:Uncharacterized protein n=1 Tax=Chondromyces apiculatus DSM 436 TaxID=1192034 RepID=A0A017T9Q5_9BACT|nr:DUF6209 family protein [Chondromyces apiculatus]EYF05356.1 Hypothetical protein CAP_3273 [Chondromyces apiculatus DSM 436]
MKRLLSLAASLASLTVASAAFASASLTFNADWSVVRAGQPTTAAPLFISYNTNRLPQCRGTGWTITGYQMTNRGPVSSFPVASAATPGTTASVALNLATGGDLELWFQVTDSTGCSAWDSNYQYNFHADVLQNPTLTYADNGSESQYGTITGGSTLMVDYDIDRLGQCRLGYMNFKTWNVHVHYRIDGGAEQVLPLTVAWGQFDLEFRRQTPAFIPIPVGASEVELWFVGTDRGNCVQYDSEYGQNYVYTVQ